MAFYADLHIHSRFSRATSKDLSPEILDGWARIKGLRVIGTGDFTHPKWREELCDRLTRDEESGLYRLKGKPVYPDWYPDNHTETKSPLFCLQTEISSIYKKEGKVRKIHSLIYVPTLDDAQRFSKKLEGIGNIASDGRPILGLDAKNLLELLLETVPTAVFIPAHIWTPWFSLFGSKSGFDAIEECFEDLTDEIFALETGLSSDPVMNRYVSALDRFALVSNSDAHSGSKLAREANIFSGDPSFEALFSAIKASAKRSVNQGNLACTFLGTVEFFPEEGKYHLDGHRDCHVSLNPIEANELKDKCPVCGKPLTIGVLHRVMDLADRKEKPDLPLEPTFSSIVPLQEIYAELLGKGANTKQVLSSYAEAVSQLDSELPLLLTHPLSSIKSFSPDLYEAIRRLRNGEVLLEGGFDGEFGRVHLFGERDIKNSEKSEKSFGKKPGTLHSSISQENLAQLPSFRIHSLKEELSEPCGGQTPFTPEQKEAICHGQGPALVLAGPGSGKTHLLLGRISHLLEQNKEQSILALTFTRKAAEQLRNRLAGVEGSEKVQTETIHAFCWKMLRKNDPNAHLLSEDAALVLFGQANPALTKKQVRVFFSATQKYREMLSTPRGELAQAALAYERAKNALPGCYDFIDVLEWLNTLEEPPHCDAVLVDEIQDCSLLNVAVITKLLPLSGAGFFGIGDPDQAIYAFRGAVSDIRLTLEKHWPHLTIYKLNTSFRSSAAILEAAGRVLPKPQCGFLSAAKPLSAELRACTCPNAVSEARWIARTVSSLLGATSHSLLDSGSRKSAFSASLAPDDIAILVRFAFLMPPIGKALAAFGIPYSCPSAEAFWHDPFMAQFLEILDPSLPMPRDVPFTDSTDPRDLFLWFEKEYGLDSTVGKSTAFSLLRRMWQRSRSWHVFFEELAFARTEERVRLQSQSVQLLTIHGAKGLEFRAVFLPAMEDGIIPAKPEILKPHKELKNGETEGESAEAIRLLEEERRLCYVGVTRASELLFVSHANERVLFGEKRHFGPSPFLIALEQCCKTTFLREQNKQIPLQYTLFGSGRG